MNLQADFANGEGAGARIRSARAVWALTQEDLARELGVSLRSVQNWESGMVPSARHTRALALFFGRPVEWLTTNGSESP